MEKKAVIIIDMQKEYFTEGGFLRVPAGRTVADNLVRLAAAARKRGVPVIHVRHISKNPTDPTFRAGTDAVDFIEELTPEAGEAVITKTRPGSFYLTDLGDILSRHGIDAVIVCGLMSFMCCDTTAREAHARGYTVYFLSDGTAAIPLAGIPAETVHEVTCAIQGLVFSRVVTTDQMIEMISAE
jgi:nicotinamidase-related amidase